jgi:hypothetical protein
MNEPLTTLTLNDGVTEWTVEVLGPCRFDPADQTLTLPDPDEPDSPVVLKDFLIVEFAREGMRGLRLTGERPLRPAGTKPAES